MKCETITVDQTRISRSTSSPWLIIVLLAELPQGYEAILLIEFPTFNISFMEQILTGDFLLNRILPFLTHYVKVGLLEKRSLM